MLQVAVPNHLGDAVMALPALRALAAGLPGERLRLVGRPLPAKVLDQQGPWEDVRPGWVRDTGAAAVLLAPSMRVALGALRARCRIRVGTPTDWRRPLLTHSVRASIRRHHQREVYRRVVERALALLGGVIGEADDRFRVDDSAGEGWWRDAGRPAWLLHPWAQGDPRKRWPADRWVALGRELGDVAITGGPGGEDAELAVAVARELGVPVAAGRDCLAVDRWAGVSRLVRGLVLPDTGLAHLASAAGARPVVLFGATDPARYAPARCRVVRARSMRAIRVARVAEEVRA